MDRLLLQPATLFQHSLLIASLADGRSRFMGVDFDEQSRLLLQALLSLGVAVIVDEPARRVDVAGSGGYWPNSDAEMVSSDSFSLACLLAAACALGRGQYTVICDLPPEATGALVPLLSALVDLRATVHHERTDDRLYIHVGSGVLHGGATRLPMGCPSAILESLLTVAPYASTDVLIESRGQIAHATEHLLPLMDEFGVSVLEDSARFVVPAPQRYRGREMDLGSAGRYPQAL